MTEPGVSGSAGLVLSVAESNSLWFGPTLTLTHNTIKERQLPIEHNMINMLTKQRDVNLHLAFHKRTAINLSIIIFVRKENKISFINHKTRRVRRVLVVKEILFMSDQSVKMS